MKSGLKQIVGAIIMGLIWAGIWALLSILAGTITMSLTGYSLEDHLDPLAALGLPGFIVGLIFYVVVMLGSERRRVGEYSLSRFAMLGALVGGVMGLLALSLGSPNHRLPLGLVIGIIVGASTFLSTVSAIISRILFRFFWSFWFQPMV